MSVVNHYRVVYHFEVGGKKTGPVEYFTDNVIAAASDYASLKTILVTNNGRGAGAGLNGNTLVIDNIEQKGGSALS